VSQKDDSLLPSDQGRSPSSQPIATPPNKARSDKESTPGDTPEHPHPKRDIRSLTAGEASRQFSAWGHKGYRVTQLLQWVYAGRAATWDEMSNLPQKLRDMLSETYLLQLLELVKAQESRDGTVKFLFKLRDGELIESVLIPASLGEDGIRSERHTLCISTQVGCAYGCKFCASGLMGWKRNLHVEEIIDQILAVEEWRREEHAKSPCTTKNLPKKKTLVDNVVVMGMGEPLANYGPVTKGLRILNAPWGLNIGARKITVSTSGLAPEIRKLADNPLQYRLAISLHGATDVVRDQTMPINKKYPLTELMAACEYYHEKQGRMITFEYIMIAGLNDGLDQVEPLARMARAVHAKVNLIPYNRVEGLPWEQSSEADIDAFAAGLQERHIPVTIRREKGADIDAACGQLRLKAAEAALEPDGDDSREEE